MDKGKYLEHASCIAEYWQEKYDGILRERKILAVEACNYNYLAYLAFYAEIEAVRYSHSKDEKYARRAKRAVLDLGEFRDSFLEGMGEKYPHAKHPGCAASLPVLEPRFSLAHYIKAYTLLENSGFITEEERKRIEEYVASGANQAYTFLDWGAHNRAVLRAVNLISAAEAFPENPNALKWRKAAEILVEDSWKKWSVEDTSMYNAIWLHDLFLYAEITGNREFEKHHTVQYYLHYLLAMLNPCGTITDYGDAVWGSHPVQIACMEKGAAIYRSAEMKYAADRLFKALTNKSDIKSEGALRGIGGLLSAYQWADDSVSGGEPDSGSTEVLDEVIGKKIVFRNGWSGDATFLMLNYRDEGDYGYLTRNFLRNTIQAKPEKMHHGHADENSIVSLISGGNVLLHDGGYRDNTNPTGQYRADFYHNSVMMRKGRPLEGQTFLNYCVNRGDYKAVRTEKIYFYTFNHIDVSRTRVTNPYYGTVWDRSIHYLKSENIFIIMDSVKVEEMGEYSFGPVFFTQEADQIGHSGYQTKCRFISSSENYSNKDDAYLLIHFAEQNKKTEVETIRRCHTDEKAVSQHFSGYLKGGDIVPFVTVLYPNNGKEDLSNKISKITVSEEPCCGVTVQYRSDSGLHTIGNKLDLSYGVANLNDSVTYTFEKGAVDYNGFKTDAAFIHCFQKDDRIDYAIINATRVEYGENNFFGELDVPNLNEYNRVQGWAFKGKPHEKARITTWWNRWEDSVIIKK